MMTVKDLIIKLLDMPMDSDVSTVIQRADYIFAYSWPSEVIDYEDGTIGIVAYREESDDNEPER